MSTEKHIPEVGSIVQICLKDETETIECSVKALIWHDKTFNTCALVLDAPEIFTQCAEGQVVYPIYRATINVSLSGSKKATLTLYRINNQWKCDHVKTVSCTVKVI